jgi:hypothetical protein
LTEIFTPWILDGAVEYGPAVVAGVAYIGTGFGTVYAIGSAGEAIMAGTPESATLAQPRVEPVLVKTITGGDAPLAGPAGVAVDGDGNLDVVDTRNDQIKISSASAPRGPAMANWGTVKGGSPPMPTDASTWPITRMRAL